MTVNPRDVEREDKPPVVDGLRACRDLPLGDIAEPEAAAGGGRGAPAPPCVHGKPTNDSLTRRCCYFSVTHVNLN